jgi:hypothetical protein
MTVGSLGLAFLTAIRMSGLHSRHISSVRYVILSDVVSIVSLNCAANILDSFESIPLQVIQVGQWK